MTIEVFVSLEPVGDGSKIAWWAVAPAVGNLAVAADSLRELEELAHEAIADAVAENNAGPYEVRFTLVSDPPRSAGDARSVEFTPTTDDARAATHEPSTAVGLEGSATARELVAV